MTDRHTVDTITSDALDELYADLARYEEIQGDMNERAVDLTRQLASAEAAIARVRAALASFDRRGVLAIGHTNLDIPTAGEVRAAVRAALDGEPAAPICELPHQTIAEEDACEQQRLAAEAARQMDADPHGLDAGMIVKSYRDHGQEKWVFRCWGTSTCDGWLSLDHDSQQSAERARDRHVAEQHGEPAAPAATQATDHPKEQ